MFSVPRGKREFRETILTKFANVEGVLLLLFLKIISDKILQINPRKSGTHGFGHGLIF
jgi:hypothetical protein